MRSRAPRRRERLRAAVIPAPMTTISPAAAGTAHDVTDPVAANSGPLDALVFVAVPGSSGSVHSSASRICSSGRPSTVARSEIRLPRTEISERRACPASGATLSKRLSSADTDQRSGTPARGARGRTRLPSMWRCLSVSIDDSRPRSLTELRSRLSECRYSWSLSGARSSMALSSAVRSTRDAREPRRGSRLVTRLCETFTIPSSPSEVSGRRSAMSFPDTSRRSSRVISARGSRSVSRLSAS